MLHVLHFHTIKEIFVTSGNRVDVTAALPTRKKKKRYLSKKPTPQRLDSFGPNVASSYDNI